MFSSLFNKNILILLFFVIVSIPNKASSQKSAALQEFYKHEQQNWCEYLQKINKISNNSNFDVLFYHLDVNINISSRYIKGNVLCRFKAAESNIQTIKLNLHNSLSIDSLKGNFTNYNFTNDTISITLDRNYFFGETGEIQIFYQGVPELAGGYKGLRYETHGNSEPIIATLSTPFLAHYWWPCKDGPGDKPDSVYIDITIPDTTINGIPVIAVSNGMLKNVITQNGYKTFQWRHLYPITPYYVMAAISNYRTFQQTFNGSQSKSFPIDYYVFDEHLNEAQDGVADLPAAIEFFSSKFGAYPFHEEKYGMTQLGYYGGIENQTNTIINNMSLDWFDVSVHELAHMWFGDMITCKDWHHGWLNEGFATYSEALWAEHTGGYNAYLENIAMNEYYEGGTLHLHDISNPFQIFIGIIYSKGAYVLHMLRGVLGDQLFFESIYEYATTPEFMYGEATTEDFKSVCENVSQIDLTFFFDQWIYDEYYPAYEYDYGQNFENLETTVIINQTQSRIGRRSLFEMPIQLEFFFNNGSDTLVTVWNNEQAQEFTFQFSNQITNFRFDPNQWMLKEAILNNTLLPDYSSELVLEQNAPNPFSRFTKINFFIPNPTNVTIKIFNILGQEIRTLLDKKYMEPGPNFKEWDGQNNFGNNVSAGIYFYQIQTDKLKKTKKMILLRE